LFIVPARIAGFEFVAAFDFLVVIARERRAIQYSRTLMAPAALYGHASAYWIIRFRG
jgi:hypothetical protein